MELKANMKGPAPQQKFSPAKKTQNRNPKLSKMTAIFTVSPLQIILFALFSVFILNPSHAASTERGSIKCYLPNNLMEFWKDDVDQSEQLKKCAWDNWMMRLESEWENFNTSMKSKKNVWLQETEQEWTEWIKQMENKWMNCNENINDEYKDYLISKSATWTDEEWKEWIKTEGKNFMKTDLEKWIKAKETSLDLLLLTEWVQWKNEKIMAWLLSEWKTEEDTYWSQWEHSTWLKWLNLTEKKHWLKWKERNHREGEQWSTWLHVKENVYIFSEWNNWSIWKNEKEEFFYKWMEDTINEWINEKRWNTLVSTDNDS
ncbi:tryptophan-rich antigen (Pv-fam-a) [Plasmodium vivax Mauritania I]|uniref:Tryptophan-rich antigen (Pv-fam-a) n=1 Tax=Plasmodium vivax Mauritania I TaxID=1035515 RepID=A0A0J9TCT9_PLAVI|nr:tryptophan-rich antigen (Pv-fam-a) [Plasmodium vivax Mauritania I]